MGGCGWTEMVTWVDGGGVEGVDMLVWVPF